MHKLDMYPNQDFLKNHFLPNREGGASSQMDYFPLVFQLLE